MRTAILILAAAVMLSSCGKMGALERPDPLFGKPAPSEPEKKTP